jgi:hypothetical protein
MKTINVKISEGEYSRFGFNSETIDFTELLLSIKRELAKEALDRSVKLAHEFGIANLTDEEIEAEIKDFRNDKRNS